MAQQYTFATQLIKTTEGWFEAGHAVPQHDLPEAELRQLYSEGKIGVGEYHSPLVQAAHQARKLPRGEAEAFLKHAVRDLSPEGGREPGFVDDDSVDVSFEEPVADTESAPVLSDEPVAAPEVAPPGESVSEPS